MPIKNAPSSASPVAAPSAGPFKLVAIDLDGTLLRSDKKLTKRSVEAVAEATRRGVHVVLASARPPRSVREIYQRLGLTTFQVNYNGALVHDMPRKKHVFHQPLTPKLATRIVKFARKLDPDVVVSAEILDKWYTDRVDETLITETSRFHHPDFMGPLESFLHVPVTKLMLLAPPERLKPVREAIARKFGREVAILISDKHLIQIVHVEVDKAAALQRVAQNYGIERENVMAIGDAPNDLGMLRWAGLGVAMANGWPQARAAADVIVPSNDEDGVAIALERYVLNTTDRDAPIRHTNNDATVAGH